MTAGSSVQREYTEFSVALPPWGEQIRSRRWEVHKRIGPVSEATP